VLSGLGLACRGAGGLAPADDAAIRKQYDQLSRTCAGEEADPDACARLCYAEDAVIVLPGRPAIRGREAVAALWRSIEGHTMSYEIDGLEGRDALAYARGTSTFSRAAGGASASQRWRWLDIWKKQADGTWQLTHDAASTEEPSGLVLATAEPRADASPELLKLASWVGRWRQEGEYKQTPISPASRMGWDLDCRWIAGGHRLGCSAVGSGASAGYGELLVIGYDAQAKRYDAFDADSNGFVGYGRAEALEQGWRFTLDSRVEGKPARAIIVVSEPGADEKTLRADIAISGAPAVTVYEGKLARAK
jgi:ketosteroid isomerase-like protein